ncbi:MAG: DNA gyrase inhibitor YacG [Bdellovibrionota bacterium]|nr:MAG: DNA gyrase inhibitor YacG [Bdellovibrionota bacterium]
MCRCPSCRKPFESSDFFPFCCQRCKVLDLGGWLQERYRIPSQTIAQIPAEIVDAEKAQSSDECS